MEYEEALENLYQNKKLNEAGLIDYIGILKMEIIDLKQKIIDLEYQLQYKSSIKRKKIKK